jgi:phosphoribosylglycinamide formyltransferase-1
MKWSILNDKPLGVTSHIISEEADQGWLIKRTIVPLFEWDTFHSVAVRQYEMEMDLLASAVSDIPNASMESLKDDSVDVKRRMSNKLQKQMVEYFPKYLKKQLLMQSH